jgi:predicted hotdog family 3-hydroxylacyl-ACP dehydratase
MTLRPEDQIDLALLIPHRGESLLLDRIVDHDDGCTTARVIVGSRSCLLRDDDTVPAWLVVEYMAQTIAVHEGYVARSEGRTLEIGFLVTVVRLEIQPVTLRSGESLQIHARRVRGRPGLGVVSHKCTVHRVGDDDRHEIVAEGRLSIAIKGLGAGALAGHGHAPRSKRRDRSD